MVGKKGAIMNTVILHIILIGFIFAIFLYASADRINARGVRQQVLERQTALLIDSAVPGMSFEIHKNNPYGFVSNVELRDGQVFVSVEGLGPIKGYPYFSKHSVSVVDDGNKFVVKVR